MLQAWALFGMMFGALVLGPLADRIGRKKGIAISFLLFTLATLATGFATSLDQFKAFRFIAGLGCGGLMPNAAAVPLLLLPFILWKLPESLCFLIRQSEQQKARAFTRA
ncbi:hypothetical protein BA190_01870 [Labrys sp. WJW]|nr:hypothetical protein BA190_01870 [Labrys sp. WJW]